MQPEEEEGREEEEDRGEGEDSANSSGSGELLDNSPMETMLE